MANGLEVVDDDDSYPQGPPRGLALTRIERVHAAPAVAVSWGYAAAEPINVNLTPGGSHVTSRGTGFNAGVRGQHPERRSELLA